jgi:hypothetical protein
LQAGCKQDPQDGTLLGISGSVFSTNSINMTDTTPGNKDDSSSGGLPASAIAGIVIGVILIFLVALALLIVHFRREKVRDAWDQTYLYPNPLGPPGSFTYHGTGANMSQAYRRYYTGNAFSEKPPAAAGTAGEYYDRMQAQHGRRKVTSNGSDDSEESHGSSTTMNLPGGQLDHRGVSRAGGQPTSARTPSPHVPPAKLRRCNTPDSFAIQQYLQAAEDSVTLAKSQPQSAASVAESSKRRYSLSNKIPRIPIPMLSKLRSKKIDSQNISLPLSSSVSPRQEYEMQISGPVDRQDTRFHDRPLGDRVVYAVDRPSSPREQQVYYDGYVEVPLRSGKSTLYGY